MQVIGFNFEKISAERKKAPAGKLEIKSNINLKSITEEKISMIKDKDVLKFSFEFTIDYHPGIAELKFDGFVLTMVEKEKFTFVIGPEIIKKVMKVGEIL